MLYKYAPLPKAADRAQKKGVRLLVCGLRGGWRLASAHGPESESAPMARIAAFAAILDRS